MLSVIKLPRPAKPEVDPRELHIAAMYLMFLRAPARPTREDVKRGVVTDLGEIGSVQEKNWERLNPYATATPKRTGDNKC